MLPEARKKYATYFVLILVGTFISLALLAGPLSDAWKDSAPSAGEQGRQEEKAGERANPLAAISMLVFLGATVYGAHLAAKFFTNRGWRKRDDYFREVPWSVLDVAVMALLFLTLELFLYSLLPSRDGGASAGDGELTVGQMLVTLWSYIVVLLFGIRILTLRGTLFSEGMGLRIRPYRRLVLIGAAAFLAFLPFRWMYTTAVVGFFHGVGLPMHVHPVEEELLEPGGTVLKASLVFSVAISAPFFEEVFFRGFLYQALRRKFEAWGAIVVTAALFASIHPSLFQGTLVFSLGLLLGYLMEKTGSLVPCMVLHFLINATSLLLMFLKL